MTMTKLFCISLLMVTATYGADPWIVLSAHPQSITGLVGQPLDSRVVILQSEEGVLAGPMVVWKDKTSGHTLQVSNSIATADRALKATTADLKQDLKRSALKAILGNVVSGRQHMVIFGERRREFLSQMAEKVSKADSEAAASLLPSSQEKWGDNSWELAIPTVTHEGGVVLYTFYGSTKPLSIKKQVVELLAPNGTLKSFPYIPDGTFQ